MNKINNLEKHRQFSKIIKNKKRLTSPFAIRKQ